MSTPDPNPPNPDPTPTPTPPAPPDAKGLEANAKKLLDEKKKVEAENRELKTKLAEAETAKAKVEKLSALAKELGVDVNQQDPEKLREQRAAEERAKQAREQKIRDGVMFGLLESGRKLPEKVARGIVTGALADPSISLGDDGTLVGVQEYLAGWLSSLAPSGDGKGTPPGPPSPTPGGSGKPAGELPEKYKNVNSLLQLQAMPMADQIEFVKTYPEQYSRLRAMTRASLANPLPPPPPAMAQPQQVKR